MPTSWQRIPNRDLFKGLAFLGLLVILSHLTAPLKKQVQIQQNLPIIENFEPPQKGVMVTAREKAEVEVSHAEFKSGRLLTRYFANRAIGVVGQGSDKNFYYANGYYQDFVPFEVTNVYNAMNFVALRLKYQYDEEQFDGISDIWQTSKEAYVRMRGDCEDHAILLADWLETLGFDARVAIGVYKGGGHAWVVWFNQGDAYIIEATSKRKERFFPLATTMKDYEAYYMFNKTSFWQKSGATFIDDYKSRWYKTASFKPQKKHQKNKI